MVVVVVPVLNFSFVVLVRFVKLKWFEILVRFVNLLIDRVWKLPLEVVAVAAEPVALRRLRSWLSLLCECVLCELKLPVSELSVSAVPLLCVGCLCLGLANFHHHISLVAGCFLTVLLACLAVLFYRWG